MKKILRINLSKNFCLSLYIIISSLFANNWIWQYIFKGNYLKVILMIATTWVLIFLPKIKNNLKYLLIISLALTGLFKARLSKTVFSLSETEIYQINQSRSFYPENFFGRISENKITSIIFNYEKNFFQGIDINYYFFANHPRERAGITELNKFYWIFLSVFMLGIYSQLKNKYFANIIIFIGTLLIISLFENFDNYSFLLFPFFIVSFISGFKLILPRFKQQ